MRYCHECGSQIAEIDLFCPFCGITQKPFVTEDEGIDERTIAVSDLELIELAKKSAAASKTKESKQNKSEEAHEETESTEKQKEINKPEKPQTVTSENWAMKTDSVDIPVQTLSKMKDSAENIPTAEKVEVADDLQSENEIIGDQSLEESAETEVPKPALLDSETDAAENPFSSPSAGRNDFSGVSDSPVAPRLYEDQKSEILFSGSVDAENLLEIDESASTVSEQTADTSESDADEDADFEEEIDLSSTIAYTPENLLIHSNKNKRRETPEESEPEQINDGAISIPDEPIESADDSNIQFDSVRIMQDHDSDVNTLLKTAAAPVSNPRVSKPPVRKEVKASEIQPVEDNEKRSYTTPNFGNSDTEGGRRSAKLKPLSEGTILNGRYEIVRKIGGGGMGAVYLATDKNLGGILRAVKEMVQSYIEETAQDKAVSDFKRESMLLTSLDHPSIPTIYDYFYDEKEARFYLVMKYISGGDLASRLRSATEGRLDEETVTEWAVQIADVLDYLHSRQPPIVYRDLKPSNIMIDGNSGRVMLIDFGIARWVNKEEKGVTAVGTMGYAPPELFSGNVEPRSDIYSLGSTMFHLLTGADPQSNPLLIFDFQKHPRPRQINPQLSDQMEKILMRAVEYNADNRFRNAAEMKNALLKHLHDLQGGTVSYGIAKTPRAVSLADQNVFCGFCGQKIVATDLFCAYCGSKQPLAQQGVNSAEYISPQTTAKLIIIGTSDLDAPSYKLEKDDNLLGRRDPLSNIFPEIDLSKFDPQTKVSRRHARIWRKGTQYLIEDLGSSNGTVVMRVVGDSFRLIPHQPHPLTNGEKLKVGDTTLHFIIG